jgi:2-dehydro-3-deoxyphosphogluconate aldolase / (4S)-4-hydroxy-2-oxoglutarate aldolase
MTAPTSRLPLSDRLTSSKVIAVLRASHVSALAPVCDVLAEEGILSLELTLTTCGLLGALSGLVDRYAHTADVGVGTVRIKMRCAA